MSCSSARFTTSDDTLEAAQQHKIHRMCQMLRLSPGMRLLEIGCGWGSFAEVAARDYGVERRRRHPLAGAVGIRPGAD